MAYLYLAAATAHDLATIARFIEEECDAAPITPRALFHLKLAVDEACTNILEHAYDGRAGPLGVEIVLAGEAIQIEIRDWGAPFDPTEAPPPSHDMPLEQRPNGGMGIHLIRQVMDSLSYRAGPEGNRLLITKRLAG